MKCIIPILILLFTGCLSDSDRSQRDQNRDITDFFGQAKTNSDRRLWKQVGASIEVNDTTLIAAKDYLPLQNKQYYVQTIRSDSLIFDWSIIGKTQILHDTEIHYYVEDKDSATNLTLVRWGLWFNTLHYRNDSIFGFPSNVKEDILPTLIPDRFELILPDSFRIGYTNKITLLGSDEFTLTVEGFEPFKNVNTNRIERMLKIKIEGNDVDYAYFDDPTLVWLKKGFGTIMLSIPEVEFVISNRK